MRIRRGFTLAELMVVIGIIVVLLAILLPALRGVRESARSAQCASNERNILQAMAAYATANDGVIPAAPDARQVWTPADSGRIAYFFDPKSRNHSLIEFVHGSVMKYLSGDAARRSTLRCPDADDGTVNYSYVLHYTLKVSVGDIRTFQVVRPDRKIILFEDDNPNDGSFRITATDDQASLSIHHFRTHGGPPRSSSPTARLVGQDGRGNYGFVDGHVESFSPAELIQPKWVKELTDLVQ